MNNVNTRPYHHGRLHDALVEESLALLREKGPDAVTLREAARRAGVTPSAAYRHFTSRDALMEAVGDEVLRALQHALAEAVDELAGDAPPRDRLRAAGRAYVRFALRESSRFRMLASMTRDTGAAARRRDPAPDPFLLLRDLVREASDEPAEEQAEAEQSDAQPGSASVDDLAVALWSSVHGLSVLLTSGALRGLPPDRQDHLIDSTVERAVGMVP
ncbi:TetR/AcrR family transcriptional regulator [Brachybacterium kimchii]|uniref:WHG domain-containing protein n=1 Tax=Brachybacterium kimchii TaxID=2942909 RepID=A0ABY4N5S7_9MICO|nr:WHG domain-containing protein [Brachybacterium kimchii]UQN29913.1 WHG domain-containing protein [Brachybacterium kimchii]